MSSRILARYDSKQHISKYGSDYFLERLEGSFKSHIDLRGFLCTDSEHSTRMHYKRGVSNAVVDILRKIA